MAIDGRARQVVGPATQFRRAAARSVGTEMGPPTNREGPALLLEDALPKRRQGELGSELGGRVADVERGVDLDEIQGDEPL
jgi:hypothetical protein